MRKIAIVVIIAMAALLVYFSISSRDQAVNIPSVSPTPIPLHSIGQVTRHVSGFADQIVRVQGYMLVAPDKNYVIFSDEAGGAVSSFDLPVTGLGIETLVFKNKYILQGRFIYGGLNASNHNQYHLELLIPPQYIR